MTPAAKKGIFIGIVLLLILIGSLLYYFKVYKPKKALQNVKPKAPVYDPGVIQMPGAPKPESEGGANITNTTLANNAQNNFAPGIGGAIINVNSGIAPGAQASTPGNS